VTLQTTKTSAASLHIPTISKIAKFYKTFNPAALFKTIQSFNFPQTTMLPQDHRTSRFAMQHYIL